MTYAWIHQHRDSFPVALLCEVFAVSKSGYYASIDRPVSPRARRHERIQAGVAQVHARSHAGPRRSLGHLWHSHHLYASGPRVSDHRTKPRRDELTKY